MRVVFVFLCLLVVPVSLAPQVEPTRVAARREPTMRPEIVGQHGIVAGGRHYSVHAGTADPRTGRQRDRRGRGHRLRRLGGRDLTLRLRGRSADDDLRREDEAGLRHQRPGVGAKAATPELFKAKGKVDSNGPLGATMPAVMDAMAIALERFGTMRLEQVMAPAIELADGFPMYAFLRDFLVSNRERTEAYKWGHLYYANGRVPDVGEVFRSPTSRAPSARSSPRRKRRFRRRRIAAPRSARAATRSTRATSRGALRTQPRGRRGLHLRGSRELPRSDRKAGDDDVPWIRDQQGGSWNQGPVLLETLNILEGVDLKAMGANSADYLHNVHEAIKLAYDDRNAYLGDPAFASVPLKGLLSKPYAAERRKQIGPKAFLEHRPGDPYPFDPDVKPPAARYYPHSQGVKGSNTSGDTTCVDTVDKDGNLFSATPSSGWLLGGAFIAGDTGVPLSNRMQVFDLDPVSPNVLAGGKRPRTTLTPTIVLKDGKAVSRHQHAWRRQPGPADPQRAAERVRVRHGPPGGNRSAARQLDAPAQLVRQPRERAG
jgi:gamma-glutamyltranspeptidase/glutathione hydrolase